MKERDLCKVFGNSVDSDGYQYVNIPDSASMVELPFDGILNFKGSFVAIEAKRLTDYKAFNPKQLRDSQIRGLTASTAKNGTSLVLLFIWKPRTYNRVLWWEWKDFLNKTDNLTKSIKANELKEDPYCECKKGKFNLEKFYKFLDTETSL